MEEEIRRVVPENELGMIVSNIGISPGFSAIYTPNSAQHTAFVQVSLKEGHKVGSYEYMDRVRIGAAQRLARDRALIFNPAGLLTPSSTSDCPRRSIFKSAAQTWTEPTRRQAQLLTTCVNSRK